MTGRRWNPRAHTVAIIDAARRIIDNALAAGYRFTLRRVFYKLVSVNAIPNTERAYKNLSVTLDRARWEGLLPPNALGDLGRVIAERPAWLSPEHFGASVLPQYRTNWWRNANPKVELWAEKQAVSGILEPVAREYGIPYLAMRGFGSFTAVYRATQRTNGTPARIIYVGDFDPSGVEMDNDLNSRLSRMGADARIVRVALTRDQVDDYDLLPPPTKRRDSRAKHWPHEGSWELDALDEDILVGLVREAIEDRLPSDYHDLQAEDAAHRETMMERFAA